MDTYDGGKDDTPNCRGSGAGRIDYGYSHFLGQAGLSRISTAGAASNAANTEYSNAPR